jgi:hypothetical protein
MDFVKENSGFKTNIKSAGLFKVEYLAFFIVVIHNKINIINV